MGWGGWFKFIFMSLQGKQVGSVNVKLSSNPIFRTIRSSDVCLETIEYSDLGFRANLPPQTLPSTLPRTLPWTLPKYLPICTRQGSNKLCLWLNDYASQNSIINLDPKGSWTPLVDVVVGVVTILKRKDLLMDPFAKIQIFICERFRFTEFRDIFLSSSGMITLICIISSKAL